MYNLKPLKTRRLGNAYAQPNETLVAVGLSAVQPNLRGKIVS